MKTIITNIKRVIAVFLSAACAAGVFCTSAYADSGTVSYRASEYFSTESAVCSPWSNQFYDFMGIGGKDLTDGYKDMIGRKAKSEHDNSVAWMSVIETEKGDYSWGDRAPYICGTYMRASTSASAWVTYNQSFENYGWVGRNYPVKTFTAPEAGTVTIKAAEDLTVTGQGTHVRIMKLAEGAEAPAQVWPSEGWQLISDSYTFEDIRTTLEAGEKLTFENAYIKDGNSTPETVLSWDPVVEYVISNAYKASEYFGASNPSGPWTAMYYDYDAGGEQRSRYKNMMYFKESEWINHDPSVTTGSYQWGNNSARIGRTNMLADTYGNATDDEKSGKIGRDYPVRAFTASKRGTVSISAEGLIVTDNIDNGTHIRIMKFTEDDEKGTQVWPTEGWENVKGEYAFPEISVDVKQDDMLTFENAFIYTQAGSSPWHTIINWDPIVSYERIYPSLSSVYPMDGAENISLNEVHTFMFDGEVRYTEPENVTVKEITAEGEAEAAAYCKSIEVIGNTVKIILDGLEEFKEYEITLSGIGYVSNDESWTTSESKSFKTGAAVQVGSIFYENGRVKADINNALNTPVSADFLVLLCEGTKDSYTVTNAYIQRRDDIGANDQVEAEAEIPSGGFIKAIILKDIMTAVPYGDAVILEGE